MNVQEQTALRKHAVLQEARYWRNHSLPSLVEEFFISKGIDLSLSILFKYEQNFPGCGSDIGMILTQDQRFYEFDLDVQGKSILVDAWQDITDDLDLSHTRAGSGPTSYYLALEVQKEINV